LPRHAHAAVPGVSASSATGALIAWLMRGVPAELVVNGRQRPAEMRPHQAAANHHPDDKQQPARKPPAFWHLIRFHRRPPSSIGDIAALRMICSQQSSCHVAESLSAILHFGTWNWLAFTPAASSASINSLLVAFPLAVNSMPTAPLGG